MIDHDRFRELAAGAALDDLEPSERAAFEAHVTGCAVCGRLTTDLDAVLGDLALVAPGVRPPSSLRTSVFAAIRAIEDQA